VLCENVIGHVNLYQYFNDASALKVAKDCWTFIDRHLVDHVNGEWHWAVDDNGKINLDDDKAGFWKCPYHNSRMCLEIIERQV
jgi:mannobiose 2-epimerase